MFLSSRRERARLSLYLRSSLIYLFAFGLTLSGVSGCVTEYSFVRDTPERGTFGEEVYDTLHRDTQWSPRAPEARRVLLEGARDQLVIALDQVVTEERLRPLEETLRLTTPLQDSGLIPNLSRKVAQVLEELSSLDAPLRELSTRRDRRGDRAFNVHSALLERLVNAPHLSQMMEYITRVISEHDGFNDQGVRVYDEPALVTQLITRLVDHLRTLEARGDPRRFEVFMSEVLLWDSPQLNARPLTSEVSGGTLDAHQAPLWVVRLDHRGLPRVKLNQIGEVYAPFIDRDADGLADVGSEGEWLDFFGQGFQAEAFAGLDEGSAPGGAWTRDGIGRAIINPADRESFLFDYVDLSQTIMSLLIEESESLIARGLLFDLFDVLPSLLPARSFGLNHQGEATTLYPPEGHLLLDLLYAVRELMSFDRLDELFTVSARLLRDHEATLAKLFMSGQALGEELDADPLATLTEGNTLVDDLIEASAPLMSAEVLIELIDALRAPVLRECAAPFNDLLSYHAERAAPPMNGLYNACFQRCASLYEIGTAERLTCIRACPRGEIFVHQISDQRGESNRDGIVRSHWERTLALFRTTAGATYEMRVMNLEIPFLGVEVDVASALPPLLRIEDVAEAYIKAVAGDLSLADYVTDEALESADVRERLLSSVDRICGSGALESLVSSLVNVTADELDETCERFERASRRDDLSEEERTRQQIAIMVTLLSRLTDMRIDERPSPSQLTRFFNAPNPSLDLNIGSLSLSQIVDHDGYLLWRHHGDMLYAVEASGLLDCVHPLFQALSRTQQASTFARIASTLDAHYPTPQVTHVTATGEPSPRAGVGTGLVRVEAALRRWLSSDQLFIILNEVAEIGERIESPRGYSLNHVIASLIPYVMKSTSGCVRRDQTSTHLRADGRAVALSPFWLLFDTLDEVSDRVEVDPRVAEKWDRVVDELASRLFEVELDPLGEAQFVERRWLTALRGGLEVSGRWAGDERDGNRLRATLRDDVYGAIEAWALGETFPLIIDLYQALTSAAADRELLTSFASYALSQPARGSLSVVGYRALTELLEEPTLIQLASLLAQTIDPQKNWRTTADQRPLLSHGVEVWRATHQLVPRNPLIELIRSSLSRSPALTSSSGDPQGVEPLWVLGDLLLDYHREVPRSDLPRSARDYALATEELSRWLLNDERGLEELYQLVQLRQR